MSKALSLDLRERALAAIAGGMSGRQAALGFAVSAASASRRRTLERKQGDAKSLGGDRRSKRIEAHAEVIPGENSIGSYSKICRWDGVCVEPRTRHNPGGPQVSTGTHGRYRHVKLCTLGTRMIYSSHRGNFGRTMHFLATHT
jgi:hypothetical protein